VCGAMSELMRLQWRSPRSGVNTGVEEAVLHWSGKSVKAVQDTELSTFIC